MARKKTAGERTFEQYADENSIRSEYHPLLDHPERPDYLAHTIAGEVLCEVEDFGQGELDELVAAKQSAKRVRLPDGMDVGGFA